MPSQFQSQMMTSIIMYIKNWSYQMQILLSLHHKYYSSIFSLKILLIVEKLSLFLFKTSPSTCVQNSLFFQISTLSYSSSIIIILLLYIISLVCMRYFPKLPNMLILKIKQTTFIEAKLPRHHHILLYTTLHNH